MSQAIETQSQSTEQDKIKAIRELGLTVTPSKTQPTRSGKQPKDIWEISGVNLRKYEHILRDEMGLRMWKGKFTAWENPIDELLELLQNEEAMSVEDVQNYAAQRSEARAERLDERSEKHAEISNQAYERSRQITQHIPLGQPILVGHHSEKRHRSDLRKSDSAMRKSVDEYNYSKELAGRSAGAERNARMKSAETCTLEYAGNRLKEAQAEFNHCERELNLQLNNYVIYNGKSEEFKGMKAQVVGLSDTHCNISFSRPDDVSFSDWNYPTIKGVPLDKVTMILSENYRIDLENRKANAAEAIGFWTQIIKDKGGDKYSKETIKKGDYVNYWGGWRQVVRVNKKSVSVQTQYSWTDTVEYTKLKGHMTAEKYNELTGKSE